MTDFAKAPLGDPVALSTREIAQTRVIVDAVLADPAIAKPDVFATAVETKRWLLTIDALRSDLAVQQSRADSLFGDCERMTRKTVDAEAEIARLQVDNAHIEQARSSLEATADDLRIANARLREALGHGAERPCDVYVPPDSCVEIEPLATWPERWRKWCAPCIARRALDGEKEGSEPARAAKCPAAEQGERAGHVASQQVERSRVVQHGPAPLPDNPEFDVDMCICGEEWPHEGTESTEEER